MVWRALARGLVYRHLRAQVAGGAVAHVGPIAKARAGGLPWFRVDRVEMLLRTGPEVVAIVISVRLRKVQRRSLMEPW